MSSEFAQFLFSFACNKLETSPQLDLRQQLLHSNLIRHILLVHQSSFTSPLSSDQAASHSHQGEQQRQHNPFPMQNTVAAPSSPSSPPQSLLSLTSSSSSQARDTWNPFSFNDELDRIEFTAQQDSDVVMEEQIEPFSSSSTSSPLLDSSYYGFFYQSNSFLQQQQHHLQHLQHQQPQLLELHQIQLQYPLQQHQQKMLDEDQEYLYEASQAQEDWLDAVLEDLIEDDRDDDDVSSPEFDNGSDSDDYDRGTFEDDVERQQLSDPPVTTVVVLPWMSPTIVPAHSVSASTARPSPARHPRRPLPLYTAKTPCVRSDLPN
ncbi:hypothetical protein FBU30_005273 [Linnemannia zychae]|nr:hypothetical protein FBU30_005273 [Linnemannia zychae]